MILADATGNISEITAGTRAFPSSRFASNQG